MRATLAEQPESAAATSDCIEYIGDRTYRVGRFVTALTPRQHHLLQIFLDENPLTSRTAMDRLRASCGSLPPSLLKVSSVFEEISEKYPALAKCIQFRGKPYCGSYYVAIRRAQRNRTGGRR